MDYFSAGRPLAYFERYYWPEAEVTWVCTSDVGRLLSSRDYYYESIGQPLAGVPSGALRMLDELLVSCALAGESEVERGSWGWTVRVPMRPWGLFCGVEPEGTVCGRYRGLDDGAGRDPVGGLAVQRVSSAGGPARQSVLIPRDVVSYGMVEQYFDESEQLPALVSVGGGRGLMALSMPGSHWDEVSAHAGEGLFGFFDVLRDGGRLKRMHESVYFYGCHCSEERVRAMLSSIPGAQLEELWDGLDELETECPRCGRVFRVPRGSV